MVSGLIPITGTPIFDSSSYTSEKATASAVQEDVLSLG
jgi:hypothetical protein